ncbi:pesticin C-terminus-like muramidase [Paracoccus sp. (in: a-proteobacteria)]|uniref:pesticin C-terminus-like muramidase n=1 Tax=Paracoccus sp. TaxID=267 RepID=UPI003A89F387
MPSDINSITTPSSRPDSVRHDLSGASRKALAKSKLPPPPPESLTAEARGGLAAEGQAARQRFQQQTEADTETEGLPGAAGDQLEEAVETRKAREKKHRALERKRAESQPPDTGQPLINWELISGFEGGSQLDGYVPDPEGSQSGVTIATGFDLGQRTRGDLEDLFGKDNPLVEKLAPYTGLRQQKAVNALEARSLTISAAEANEIDRAVKADALFRLETSYNNAIGPDDPTFAELPEAAQTVIASVAFQYGDLESRTPNFWNHAVNQDWPALIAELRDFGDSYPTRRGAEADYLEDGI